MTSVSGTHYMSDQRFFTRMAIFVSLLIAFGFAQFAARGIPDYAHAPLHIHIHALLSLSWLALYVTQSVLAGNGALSLHRKLGWLGMILLVAMAFAGGYAGIQTIARNHVPPHYTAPYFLPLTQLAAVAFAGLAVAGIVLRRNPQWHRRLMFAAVIVIANPAMDRLVPGPIIGGENSQRIILAVQLILIGIVMRHDRRQLGRIHPAMWWATGVLIVAHVLTQVLSTAPAVAAMAQRIAAG